MKTEYFDFDDTSYEIVIGQNKNENWDLFDQSKSTDVWFHVANFPSCHVFLKTELAVKHIPKQVIKRCACLCKSNTKPCASMKDCEIIYASIETLEKGKHVGEIMTKNTKKIII
jgi:predicted ribosome quality control (RQC) complex YloA/Tae2 family protein